MNRIGAPRQGTVAVFVVFVGTAVGQGANWPFTCDSVEWSEHTELFYMALDRKLGADPELWPALENLGVQYGGLWGSYPWGYAYTIDVNGQYSSALAALQGSDDFLSLCPMLRSHRIGAALLDGNLDPESCMDSSCQHICAEVGKSVLEGPLTQAETDSIDAFVDTILYVYAADGRCEVVATRDSLVEIVRQFDWAFVYESRCGGPVLGTAPSSKHPSVQRRERRFQFLVGVAGASGHAVLVSESTGRGRTVYALDGRALVSVGRLHEQFK